MDLPNTVTIFQMLLPKPNEPSIPQQSTASASSITVENEKTPRILYRNPELQREIMEMAEEALPDDQGLRSEMNAFHSSRLSPWTLQSEADVVRAVDKMILHGVHRVLNMVLTNKYISYNSEVNPCPGSRLRVDVAFRDEQGIFAMIELKRSAYIIREDFESSIWDKDEAETVLGSLLEPSGRTSTISRSFRGVFNGTKQVKAYARKNGCRFVALCDYNSLVLFVFDQDRVEYDRASAFLLDEKKFRIGLLGFLMKACTDGARESQRSKGEKTGCSGSKPDGSQCKRVTTDVENTGVSSRDDSNGELRWWCKDHVHQKDS